MGSTLAKTPEAKIIALAKAREALTEIPKLETVVSYAKRIDDFEMLQKAVDDLMEAQAKIVTWWKETVRGAGGDQKSLLQNGNNGLSSDDASKALGGKIKPPTISRWSGYLEVSDAYRKRLYGRGYGALVVLGAARGTQGTAEFERYTPPEYIAAAREVFGGKIDLDPATCEMAQETVQADEHFTAEDDGLDREWHGNIWLNPPYHRVLGPKFIDKLVAEIQSGRVTSAIMLTNNCTDTEWFRVAAAACNAICFTAGRVNFTTPGGVVAPTQGQAFFYFGNDVAGFQQAFSKIGVGVKVIWA